MAAHARHIHLDFHTSELLAVGEKFDRQEFAKTLKEAHVNSIVVFAKCHHGWCYYPTKIGVQHPKLKFDLLGEQIKACREAGVKVVAYITGGWSASDAERHPEWQARSVKDGHPLYTHNGGVDGYVPGAPDSAKPECTWPYMCMSGEYGEHMKAIAKEVLDNYDVDGLFFDIMALNIPCACDSCRADMDRLGYGKDINSAIAYTVEKKKELFGELYDMTLAKRPDCTIFFNSGGASIDHPEYWRYSTHFEMENLPTRSAEGYDGIINRSKFFKETGKIVYGMTGKFHTDWGEFGGFKHPDALLQECAAMAAYGVRCNIGDQLHPSCKLNSDTYRIVGKAYEYVERIEDYIELGETNSRLGVILSDSYREREGIAKLLADSHYDFRVIIDTAKLKEKVDCLMLAAPKRLTEAQESDLCDFVDAGGKLVIFGKPEGAEKLLEKIGYESLGANGFDQDFVCWESQKEIEDLPRLVLMYCAAHKFKLEGEVMASVYEPYFTRTEEHYCSHRNTPNKDCPADYPAIVKGDKALCFAHCLGEQYYDYGNYWCRRIFESALEEFFPREIIISGLPVWGRYTMYREGNTLVLHLLGIQPIQRRGCAVLEEPCELRNIRVTLPGVKAESIVMPATKESVSFEVTEGGTSFTVNSLKGHALFVASLGENC